MSSIGSLLTATVPVTIQHPAGPITLHAFVEKVSAVGPDGDAYRKLQAADTDLRVQITNAVGEVDKAAQEVMALAPLSPERFADFSDTMRALVRAAQGEADADGTALDLAAATRQADEALRAFDGALMPDEKARAEREKALEETATKTAEAVKKLRAKQIENLAERIAFLCEKWDVTETDAPDSPMVPLTKRNLLRFSQEFVIEALEAIEKKTSKRYLQAMSSSTPSLSG